MSNDCYALILQANGESLAVEVKAGADVRQDDLKGLRAYLGTVVGATRGIVFYTGERVLQLDDQIWAIPVTALWNGFAKPVKPRKRS
jgi:uncharacterized protein